MSIRMNLLLLRSWRMATAAAASTSSTNLRKHSCWCGSSSSNAMKSSRTSSSLTKIRLRPSNDGRTCIIGQQLQQSSFALTSLRTASMSLKRSSSSSSATKVNPSHDRTTWPRSFADFVKGVPIVTRKLPVFGKVTIDFGTAMMNFGAVTSLSGFCMTDVMLLRGLSIVGSLCGIVYNVSRIPKQLNAVAWGCIFISVNLVRMVQLMAERREIKFSVEEAGVFYRFFAPHGVNPLVFRNLLTEAEWTSIPTGKLVVKAGEPLYKVHLLVHGTATAYETDDDQNSVRLYSYSSRENGCIIGATAVVDPTIIGRNYPNKIVAEEPVRLLSFSTEKLREFLQKNDASVEAALLHLMYVDLLGSLRRHRQSQKAAGLSAALNELKVILVTACSKNKIHPPQRQLIMQFMEEHDICKEQLQLLLQSEEVGWTEEEWKGGSKFVSKDVDQLQNKPQP